MVIVIGIFASYLCAVALLIHAAVGDNGTVVQNGWAAADWATGVREPWAAAWNTADDALYVVERAGCVVSRLTAGGGTTVVAGKRHTPDSADGVGAAARFNRPTGLVISSSAALYVSDTGSSTLRRVTLPDATVTTVAGLAGAPGRADGAGAAARFDQPMGLDRDGAD